MIGSNGVEKQNQKENKLKHKMRTAEFVEEKGHNEKANNVYNFQEAIAIIRRYEEIIKTRNKKTIGYNW